ncbi:hypothetical protein [Bosea psychrotolerans]|uniref:Uncharacterized protein n=1 Tax=Bosea psychrotolerans TaxID=1871628 RepID=A0A2S4MPI0_9HYPH|nr:hypothetical protein [Bosea psychrotolerans]POR56499.1 hypothetical protein CYD53_10119 [Bosea psychrotolerans]
MRWSAGLRITLASLALATATIELSAQQPASRRPVLTDVQDVATLRQIEAAGFSLGAILGQAQASSTADLTRASAAFRIIASHVRDDVSGLRAEMAANGRKLFEVTDGNVGRVIDLGWLNSPIAQFRLSAVVNRLDRRDFASLGGETGCGEVRLIYRLAYAFEDRQLKRQLASRLPFTLNAVFTTAALPGETCNDTAALWLSQQANTETAVSAKAIIDGPLARARLSLKQVEINAQIVRFPSGMETQFGGQAAYLLRVFAAARQDSALTLSPKPLENTPDIPRLKADAALRKDLVDYVRDHVPAIDQGVYLLPTRFLATKAISYSTFGSARLANHPFTEILPVGALAGLDLGATRLVRTARGVIERLDNGTCMGCHQANATAGFHMFGLDDATTSPLNRIKTGVSPHFHAETIRRAAYIEAMAAGREPDRYRPLSFAPPASWQPGTPFSYRTAGLTMPCLTDTARPAFGENWTCGSGSTCKAIIANPSVGTELGQCLKLEEARNFSGQPCLSGAITTVIGKPYLDSYKLTGQFGAFARTFSRDSFNCRPAKIGVPGGMAYRQCNAADKNFAGFTGGRTPDEICGLAGGKAFDDCVATNNFDACLAQSVTRGNRGTCSATRFCREDYMCQAMPDDVPGAADRVKDYGFCSPTYFLFQMRIDGHPNPRAPRP